MSILRFVTLTGADDKSSFTRMRLLSREFSFVEWGVLYDPALAGTSRYPTLEWIEQFATKAEKCRMRISLHLCGSAVTALMSAAEQGNAMLYGSAASKRLVKLASQFGRVQLNASFATPSAPSRSTFDILSSVLTRTEKRTRVVIQWNADNEDFCHRVGFMDGVELVVDSSQGRGIPAKEWPDMPKLGFFRVGYAGGLGPDNIAEQLNAIAKLAPERAFWVDMESSLRKPNGHFDLDKCSQVLVKAQSFKESVAQAAGEKWGKGRRATKSLQGLWLHWWVGKAAGYPMLVPPLDAVRPTYLYRPTGKFEAFEPSGNELLEMFGEERISFIPLENGQWQAQQVEGADSDHPPSIGPDIETAGLRAIVVKHFGKSVPKNPTLAQS